MFQCTASRGEGESRKESDASHVKQVAFLVFQDNGFTTNFVIFPGVDFSKKVNMSKIYSYFGARVLASKVLISRISLVQPMKIFIEILHSFKKNYNNARNHIMQIII